MATKHGLVGDTLRTDSSDDPISHRVVDAVADATGVDPLDLPPLYERVDPDALDALFRDAGGASVASVRFEFSGCEVLVRGSGQVEVLQTDAAPGTVEGESERRQDTSRVAVEDRCGIDLGGRARTRQRHS